MAIKISKGILLSMMETWVMLAFRAQDFHRLFQYLTYFPTTDVLALYSACFSLLWEQQGASPSQAFSWPF